MQIEILKSDIKANLCNLIDNDYVLLDLPYHINTGDLLIWEGELFFLKDHIHHKMLGYYNVSTFNFPKLKPETIILFHGGGNFGDVWRKSQKHRLDIIKHYPNNKIIILPQSVFYSDYSLIKHDSDIFETHHNLTICARDKVSFEFLAKHFTKNNIVLIPDMAFCIHDDFIKERSLRPNQINLLLKRTDHEYKEIEGIGTQIPKEITIGDWPGTQKPSNFIRFLYFLMIFLQIIQQKRMLSPIHFILGKFVNCTFNYYIRPKYIKNGVKFISSFENIYSTRLHGVILALLIGRNIYIIPNNNGKLQNFLSLFQFTMSNHFSQDA